MTQDGLPNGDQDVNRQTLAPDWLNADPDTTTYLGSMCNSGIVINKTTAGGVLRSAIEMLDDSDRHDEGVRILQFLNAYGEGRVVVQATRSLMRIYMAENPGAADEELRDELIRLVRDPIRNGRIIVPYETYYTTIPEVVWALLVSFFAERRGKEYSSMQNWVEPIYTALELNQRDAQALKRQIEEIVAIQQRRKLIEDGNLEDVPLDMLSIEQCQQLFQNNQAVALHNLTSGDIGAIPVFARQLVIGLLREQDMENARLVTRTIRPRVEESLSGRPSLAPRPIEYYLLDMMAMCGEDPEEIAEVLDILRPQRGVEKLVESLGLEGNIQLAELLVKAQSNLDELINLSQDFRRIVEILSRGSPVETFFRHYRGAELGRSYMALIIAGVKSGMCDVSVVVDVVTASIRNRTDFVMAIAKHYIDTKQYEDLNHLLNVCGEINVGNFTEILEALQHHSRTML